MHFHMARTALRMDSEPHRESGYGWSEGPPGNGLPDARTTWGEEYHPQHPSPVHEHNAFVYSPLPDPPPMFATSSMPPPRTGYQHLQPLITSPMPEWPSMLAGPAQVYNPPPYPAPPHVATELRSAPIPTSRGRLGTQPRKTLTDQDRRNMCKMAELHPTMKQTEIGAEFGVERSTVSKVLRNKDKYLQQDDGSRSPVRKPKNKGADPERTLANWAKKKHLRGEAVTDSAIKHKAFEFATAAGNHDAQIKYSNTTWIKKFRQQHNLLGSKSRKSSIADESEGASNPPSGAQTPIVSPCSTPFNGKEPSPSAMVIVKSEDKLKSESPQFDVDFTFGHRLYQSQSNASLASAFDEQGPFSPGPGSPGQAFFVQDPSSPFNQDPMSSSCPSSFKRPRSQTFPMVDSTSYMSPPSSEPLTPKYIGSTTLDHSPLGDMSSALSSVEELHEPSPDIHHLPPPMSSSPQGLALGGVAQGMPHHGSMNQHGHQHSSPPTPISLHSSGSPYSLAETRQALEVAMSFFKAQPNAEYEYMTAAELMKKLHVGAVPAVGEMPTGFHRVGSTDFSQYMKQE